MFLFSWRDKIKLVITEKKKWEYQIKCKQNSTTKQQARTHNHTYAGLRKHK